jgi:plasmid maintenance system antidote protein VapI
MHMNNTEIAQMVGISRPFLELICRGERNPSYPVAKSLVSVLGGTLDVWMDKNQIDTRARLLRRFKGEP